MHTSYSPKHERKVSDGLFPQEEFRRNAASDVQCGRMRLTPPHKVVHNRDKSAVSIFPWYLLSILGRVFILRRPMWYYRKHIAPSVRSNTRVERILAWLDVDMAKVASTYAAMADGRQV
jgi:hypothetical protein